MRLFALVGLLVAGCGDPLLCKSDVFVAVGTTTVAIDLDSAAPGVQADVRVRTSLDAGELVAIEILDGAGQTTARTDAVVDDTGTATIRATVPTPRATIRASATSTCGSGSDEVTFDVTAGSGCDVTLAPVPVANAHYAPLGVIVDDVVSVTVTTRPDWVADVFANDAPFTGGALPEGRVSIRAVCHDAGNTAQLSSAITTVFVDTIAPSCDIVAPASGASITPNADLDHDPSNGIQLDVQLVASSDVDGEPFALDIPAASSTIGGTFSNGVAIAGITLPSVNAAYDFMLTTADHAGNACTASHPYAVVLDGCAIAIASTSPPTVDADLATPGAQVDVGVTIDPACAGRPVTSTCGTNSPSGVVPANGMLTLRATVCATTPCEASVPCTVSTATAVGIVTNAATTLAFDNLAPAIDLAIVKPVLACGSTVSAASDAEPTIDGVQIAAHVTVDASATSPMLDVTTTAGTTSVSAIGDVTITLAPGTNSLVGRASDALGNTAATPACTVALSDLTVGFAAPAADGLVNETDGTVAGTSLTFPLCGNVSTSGAAVTVAIDGAAPASATVTGSTWCRTVTLAQSPPAHTIVATATKGSSVGSATLVLAVDVIDPDPVTDLVAISPNRQRIDATWTAPASVDHYVVKRSTVALTDANFETTGVVIPHAAPAVGGTIESQAIFPADTGTPTWIGVATYDDNGNRAPVAIVGPIVPAFDQTGEIDAPNLAAGAVGFGTAIAFGRFDDDGFDDLAIAAPTQNQTAIASGVVYVFLGGPTGLATTPALAIRGTAANQRAGFGLATVRWSSATGDDLAIGVPGASSASGQIAVFSHAALVAAMATTTTIAAASYTITVAAAANWYTGGNLGAALVATDVDGDGTVDLVAGSPLGGGIGGVTTIFGPLAGGIVLSDLDTSGIGAATVSLLVDPTATANHQFGTIINAVDDDLVIATLDDATTAGDSVFVARGGPKPAAGFSLRAFTPGRDVRIDLVTVTKSTQWGTQVTSIGDQNGDGVRDLVIAAPFDGSYGRVLIVDGVAVGTAGVAKTTDAGVVLASITAGAGVARFGAVLATFDHRTTADIDGDGLEDLVIGGVANSAPKLFAWFGGAIPTGASTAASAPYVITGPANLTFGPRAGIIGRASWIGDVNGDGLDDVCWTSPKNNPADGGFEVLYDL